MENTIMELIFIELILSAVGFIAAGWGYCFKKKLDKETKAIFDEAGLEW